MAQIPSTPRPNTTAPANQPKPDGDSFISKALINARAGGTGPSDTAKPKVINTAVSKALDAARLDGASKEAKKGVSETREAIADERNGAVVGYRAGKAAVNTAIAGVGDVDKKIEDGAKAAGEKAEQGAKAAGGKVLESTKPITGPTVREVKEGGKEIAGAGKGFIDTSKKARADLRSEVAEEWQKGDGGVEKWVGAGGEALENITEGNIKVAGSLLKVGKEVGEGAFEVGLHNPVNSAAHEGVKGMDRFRKGAAGWIGDRISGGVVGAAKAANTVADTRNTIRTRTEDQRKQNAAAIADAGANALRTQAQSSSDLKSEVAKEWSKGEDGLEKFIGAGGEIAENVTEGGIKNTVAVLNVGKEDIEGDVKGVLTDLQNTRDAFAGGYKAAGDYLGGVFR